jgi:hypothetical protein
MYFECNDAELGIYLTYVPFWQGIIILIFGRSYAKFIPWWKIKRG